MIKDGKKTRMRRVLKPLLRLNDNFPLFTLSSFFLAGILIWGGFNWSLEITNQEPFCISCHEMRDNVYEEYKKTIHYSNRTGVRATCPDCHVPKDWIHKVTRKIRATNELYHAFKGSIDTREKFLAKRFELAKHVWTRMKETDSKECRNCHGFEFMNFGMQRDAASERHGQGAQQGKTCIDCHKGIAHTLPEEFLDAEHERFEQEKVPCSDCHADMGQAPTDDGWED